MDLTFQKTNIPYLQTAVTQTGVREETAEITLPEGEPDIGRVIGAWAVPVVRSKELQGGRMSLSGGMNVWVLYAPADEGDPRPLRAYIPFSMGWDTPGVELWDGLWADCRMHSMDARMSGARKLILRGTVACEAAAYVRKEGEIYSLPAPPKEVEVLKQSLPMSLPSELCEKQFSMEEAIALPSGMPPMEKIVAWQLEPEITDSKVMGDKGVFKGSLRLHIIYMTPENRLAVWDHTLPFSQYTQLEQHYDREETLECQMLLMEGDLSLNEENRELMMSCQFCAQCMVHKAHLLELVADVYSPNRAAQLETTTSGISARLDHHKRNAAVEVGFSMSGGTIIDATVLPSFPKVNRSGDTALIEAPVWCSILYYDDAGKLQGKTARGSGTSEMVLASGCPCTVKSRLSGSVGWGAGSMGTSLRPNLELTVDCYSQQDLTMISSASFGEKQRPRASRPSVVIQTVRPDDTLWSLAKKHNSTIEDICKANQIQPGALEENTMLLIPIQ